ncbi:hypothetical protein F3Y22_tig00000340pilonHSYRG01097 [Hibiscus syriacus]|uniref:CCHC-type domain-containing protein n=1 Tax=Hibiscus syriacus TaxID=106335 RepID=A0A6A3D4R8_HIBSY|nr:hypothetical protein F3Y22_tig00000340pilonHSYRG01097 [Hibiscus syriacus]
MHHGGFMVNSSGFKYTGKEVSFIDMCHVDSMSMLEMYDIMEELGYSGLWHLFWKQSGHKFTVKPLRTDCDIISMLEDMPRNRHIHLYLEENEANFSNETTETTQTRYHNATKTHETVITEMHETHETYETFMTELNSKEDTRYVADDTNSSVSGFEYSENDVSEEEGSVHEVHVGVDFERDFNGLNNRDEGNINVSLTDKNENDEVESLYTETESDSESDSDGRGKHRCPEFNDETDMENPQFKVGMIFGDKLKFKEAVRQYEIKNRVFIRFKRTDSVRVHVVCKEGCPWYIWASRVDRKDETNTSWQIKSYILRQDVLEDHVYKMSLSKCLRAKNLALDMVLGSHKGQYSKIYDYLGEIRSSNPGSKTILKLDNRVFERMYISLQACKKGFKGCRPIISIDGCHLKGYYGGTLLAAVGIDGNDSIYPIAYAVVESENESSWTWFLLLLATDLEIETSHNITFMSDKQKGLVEAMMHVLPNAEHRTCVRHLYSNFKNNAQFKGKNLKDALWKATRATYKKEFEDAMDELKALSKPAFDWLNAKDPAQWSKSYFSPRSKSDMLLSNLSECFNKMILEARDKPILTLMEMIRTKIMENIAKKKEVANKCWPTHAGGQKYPVSAGPSNQHAIDLENHSCSCRKWDLTGIPCIHDVSVTVLNNQRPEAYVHNSYFVTTQREIYSHFIQPMRGPNQWLIDTTYERVIPLTIRRPPGRPKKKRRKEANEPTNSHATMSKKGLMMYCSKCGQPGHNQRTCKGIVGGNMPPRRRTTTRITPSSKAATSSQAVTSQPPSSSQADPPFVFIPTPGHTFYPTNQQTENVMSVRWMPPSQEDVTASQQLSQERPASPTLVDVERSTKKGQSGTNEDVLDSFSDIEADGEDGIPAKIESKFNNSEVSSVEDLVDQHSKQNVTYAIMVSDGNQSFNGHGAIPSICFSDRVHDQIDRNTRNAIIVCLLGRTIGCKTMVTRVHALWKPAGEMQLIDLDNNYFLVRFTDERDFTNVLTKGPWMIYGSYLTIQPWSQSFKMSEKHPSHVVVWIRLPGLPYRYYTKALFCYIASFIGRVIKIDYNTDGGERGKFARLDVLVDLNKPFLSCIRVDGSIKKLEYEGLQQVCFACGVYVEPVVDISDSNLYGHWMVVDARRRRTVSNNPSMKMSPKPSFGGSRFAVLEGSVNNDVNPDGLDGSSSMQHGGIKSFQNHDHERSIMKRKTLELHRIAAYMTSNPEKKNKAVRNAIQSVEVIFLIENQGMEQEFEVLANEQ